MTTQHPEGAVFEEKAQPVPSSEMNKMALDVKINGNSDHDGNNAASTLFDTNSPPQDLASTRIKVNGTANMDDFFANQTDAPPVEFSTASPPTQGTSASAENLTSSPLPDTNTTTTETHHLSPDPPSFLPPADAAVESAVADTAVTSTIPPIVEARESDLRHSSHPLAETEADPSAFASSSMATSSLPQSVEPQAESGAEFAMDLDTPVDGGQPAELVARESIPERLTDLFDEQPATTSVPPSSEIFPNSPEREANASASSDPEQKPVGAVADTSMEIDQVEPPSMSPPGESSKVSRSREPDESEEPSAKRIKTEGDAMALDSPPAPNDSALDAQPITPYMAKELIKIIKNVVRTKNGKNFRAPVADLWPNFAEQYAEKVFNPIDLQTIEHKLAENLYASFVDYRSDVELVYGNALTFNGLNHAITISAQEVRDNILSRSSQISPEPAAPVKMPKKVKRTTPGAESAAHAAPAPRPSRAAAVAAPAAPAPTFALDPTTNTPLIRRDSTKGDGRPKREIHPPKNKDLPYNSTRPKNRKTSTELKFCEDVLNELKKPKYQAFSHPFMTPVDPVALGIPNYFSVIKNPMDLSTVSQKLAAGQYSKAKDFEADVRLIFSNCFKYNPEGNVVNLMGKQLEDVFDKKWSQKSQWIQDHSPSAQSPASHPDTDQDSEDDEDEQDDAPAVIVPGQAALRLIEEQEKLIALMGAKTPNAFMINMQQEMIQVIQKKVELENVAAAAAAAGKKSGKKQKAAKPAKKAAPAKKAGASKKQAVGRQKYMGTLEKEIISQGISQLPESVANQVLGWLKAEHQVDAEEDGTIEMDIDSLSVPTLWKIYDLIMRYVPEVEGQVRTDLAARDMPRPRPAAVAKTAPKKKNKPMNKMEQERNIGMLKDKIQAFERHSSGSQEPVMPTVEPQNNDTSGDEESDSEEE